MNVFISYAHEDRAFVTRLHDSLASPDIDVWVDTDGIEPSDRWKRSAHEAIERSDSCLFVMSGASLASVPALDELSYSAELNKRLVPICIDGTVVDDPKPEALSELSWVMMRPEDAYDDGVARVVRALRTDLELARTHTRLLVRAKDWEQADRGSNPLLRGDELAAAEEWLSRAALERGPSPTELQREFIRASRQSTTKRQRIIASISLAVAIVALALGLLAFLQRNQAIANQKLAQSRQLAANAEQALPSDPELSTTLSLDSLAVRYSPEGEAALRDAVPNVQILRTFTEGARLYSAALSGDGHRLVAGGHDGTIHVWDTATGHELLGITEPRRSVITNVVFSPDGGRILSSSNDGTARIWNAATGRLLNVLTDPTGERIQEAAFDPRARRVITASGAGEADIWDANTGKHLLTLTDPISAAPGGDGINAVRFARIGGRAITASADGTAAIWDAKTGKQLTAVTEPGQAPIYDADLSPDGRRLATVSYDGTARIWDAATGRQLMKLNEPTSATLETVSFSPNGRELVTGGLDGVARVWDAKSGVLLTPLLGHRGPVLDASFSADGRSVVTASYDGTAKIWDAAPREMVTRLADPGRSRLYDAEFSPDGQRVVTESFAGTTQVWNATTGSAETAWSNPFSVGETARFSPNGTKVVVGTGDGTVILLNASDLGPVAYGSAPGGVTSADISPNSQSLVTCSDIGTVRVWQKRGGKLIQTLLIREPEGAIVDSCEFNRSGARIATASEDGMAHVYVAGTGKLLATIHEPGGDGLKSTEFSRDGRLLVTAGYNGTVRIWNVATGKQLAALTMPTGAFLMSAEMNPAETTVLTASSDGVARIWDWRTATQLAALPVPGNPTLSSAHYSADGTRIVVASQDGTATIWSAETSSPVTELEGIARHRVMRQLTSREKARYLAGIDL